MSEMVERVALAIRDERIKWGWTDAGRKVMAIDELLARAAIAAMREPTEAMHVAANREWDGRMSARSAGVWQAMIDAALATGERHGR